MFDFLVILAYGQYKWKFHVSSKYQLLFLDIRLKIGEKNGEWINFVEIYFPKWLINAIKCQKWRFVQNDKNMQIIVLELCNSKLNERHNQVMLYDMFMGYVDVL